MKVFQFYYQDGVWSDDNFPTVDSENTLILIFGSSAYLNNHVPIKKLRHFYRQSKMIGCSSAGEILNDKIIDESLTVTVIQFEKTQLKTCFGLIERLGDEFKTAQGIGKRLMKPDLKGLIVLSDGVNVNGTSLVNGLNSVIPPYVTITGGLAGDGNRFKETWTLIDDQPPTRDMIVAVGLYGDNVDISYGSEGGWNIFGHERTVTSSKNNILYELDDKPALEVYKEYLGKFAIDLPASGLLYPLAISEKSSRDKKIVRTILGINETDQSIKFAGDIPCGAYAQLMHANTDHLIEGAGKASSNANNKANSKNENVVSIAISCVGRRLVLGERCDEELEACLENISGNVWQTGFYSYGEISPVEKNMCCDLQNQTMTLTLIRER